MATKIRSKKARFAFAAVIGAIAGILAGLLLDRSIALLAGWDAFAFVLAGLILLDFFRHSHSAKQTAMIAGQDDMGSKALDTIVLVAGFASIIAVAMLMSAKDSGLSHAVFGLMSIMLSWLVIHLIYTLRYAHLYYKNQRGGIDYNSNEKPVFTDFAYLAFTIGMTYQVSDTSITDSEIRKTALFHAVVSFIFGVVIIASTINTVVSLANG